MRIVRAAVWALALAVVPASRMSAAGAACESLKTLALEHGRVTLAESVSAGAFHAPGSPNAQDAARFAALSSFCRVTATLTPTADSDIAVEVWMPQQKER